jgi:hypothetical protein
VACSIDVGGSCVKYCFVFGCDGPAWDNVGIGVVGTLGIVAIGHVGSGDLALILSFWLVGSWLSSPLLTPSLKISCYGALNKKLMWAVLLLWLSSLIFGFFLYALINTGMFGSFSIIHGGD